MPSSTTTKKPFIYKKRGMAIATVLALFSLVVVGNLYFGVATTQLVANVTRNRPAWGGKGKNGKNNNNNNPFPKSFPPWSIPQSLVFNGLEYGNSSIDPKIPKGVNFRPASPAGMTDNLLCERHCNLDVIYTWVNGSDIPFKFKKFSTVGEIPRGTYNRSKDDDKRVDVALRKWPLNHVLGRLLSANSQDKENDELKSSTRGMKMYMKWHRGRTIIISPGHVPSWMDHGRAFFSVSFGSGFFNNKTAIKHPGQTWITEKNARVAALRNHYLLATLEEKKRHPETITEQEEFTRKWKRAVVYGRALPTDTVLVTLYKRLKAGETDKPGVPRESIERKIAPGIPSTENPRFAVMYQDVIVPEHRRLRFSSNVVEPVLYKIPSLSSVFVHMNDDYLITNTTKVSTFVNRRGGPNLYYETGVMRGGRPQWEKLVKEGGKKTWVCGVYHSHVVIKDVIDDDLGTKGRFQQIFGYVRFRNETRVEGNLTTRFFVKHSPFVYNKKVLAYLDQPETAGTFYDNVNVRGRHCNDVYVPFMHHAVAIDAPWRGCMMDKKFQKLIGKGEKSALSAQNTTTTTTIGMGKPFWVRGESNASIDLSRQVECPAPATAKLGKAAENVFMMMKDNETDMRKGLANVLRKDYPVRFVTINDGFRNMSMALLLQQFLRYHFPKASILEKPQYIPGNRGIKLFREDKYHQQQQQQEGDGKGVDKQLALPTTSTAPPDSNTNTNSTGGMPDDRVSNHEILQSLLSDYFGDQSLGRAIDVVNARRKKARYSLHNDRLAPKLVEKLNQEVHAEVVALAKRRRTESPAAILVASSMDVACPLIRSFELAMPLFNGIIHVVIDPKGAAVEKDPVNFYENMTSTPFSVQWSSTNGGNVPESGNRVVIATLGEEGVKRSIHKSIRQQEPADIGFGMDNPNPKHWRPRCFFESDEDSKVVYFHEVKPANEAGEGEREKLLLEGGDPNEEYNPVSLVDFVEGNSPHSLSSIKSRTKAFVFPRRDFLLGQTLALEDFDEYSSADSNSATHTILSLLEAAPKRIGRIAFSSLWYAVNSFMTPYCTFESCFIYI